MKNISKLQIFLTTMYVIIFLCAIAYIRYAFAGSPFAALSQTVAKPAIQTDYLYILIGELALISVIGYLEIKHKLFSKHLAKLLELLKKHPALLILFMAGGLILTFVLFGLLITILIGVVTVASLFIKVKSDFLIGAVLMLVLVFLLFPTAIGLLAAIGIAIAYSLTRKNMIAFNIFVAIGCIAMAIVLGLLLKPIYILILLSALAVYDYIAVFKTKHMQAMAKSALSIQLPVAFMFGDKEYIDKRLAGTLKKSDKPKGYLYGNGDIAFPMAVATSLLFANDIWLAVAALTGAIIGMFANMALLKTGRFKSGLPAIPLLAISMFVCLGLAVAIISFL
jgi:presenilin-like A22 family membrane protease